MLSSAFLILLLILSLLSAIHFGFILFLDHFLDLISNNVQLFAFESIMWDNSQHLLVIRPLVVPGDVLFLASEHLLLDVLLIIIFNVPFEGSSDIWEIVLTDQFHPVLLPD
jgi:hypothetical protein